MRGFRASVLALAGALMGGCGAGWERVETPRMVASHDASYHAIEPTTCVECHAEIFSQWADSHHALANRLVQMPQDQPPFLPPRELVDGEGRFSFSLGSGQPQIRYQYGNEPAETFRPVGVIGVDPLLQFIIPFPNGKFQVTSAAYEPGINEWFNVFGADARSPGEWGHWTGQGMNWNANCAYCHMTEFQKNLEPATMSYASTWAAQGIQCAQCHNHLREHVRQADKNSAPPLPGLTPAQIQANCAACHSRREELTPNTFRPGEKFNDHFRVVLPDTPGIYHADGQVADEDFVYGSMLLNRMGHAGITCLDCHNAHSGELSLPVDNNALCLTCHSTGDRGAVIINPEEHSHHPIGSAGNRCIDCHMPSNNFMVRDPRRDHIFSSPDPVLSKKIGTSNTCNRCHADQTVDWAIQWAEKWYGEKLGGRTRERALVLHQYNEGTLSSHRPLLALARSEEITGWRSALVAMLRPWAQVPEVRTFLEAQLRHERSLVRDAAVRALSELPEAMRVRLLRPLLQDPVRLVRLAAAMALPPRLIDDRLRAEVETALLMNADRPTGALRLARRELQRGEQRTAIQKWVRIATGLDPTSTAIVNDGAILLSQAGDADASLALLRQGLQQHPQNPELLFSLGLLLAERGDFAAAAQALKKCVVAGPERARAWFNLALVHDRLGDGGAALAAINKALALQPGNPVFLQAKASFLRKAQP